MHADQASRWVNIACRFTAQVYREMVNRAHEVGCFDLPNGKQALLEDDAYNMLVEMLADVMLDEGGE